MDVFIEERLRPIFEDFKNGYQKVGKLCACKQLTYESGSIPDYSNPLLQQYYQLRYMPAYLVEYYLMYKRLLDFDFLHNVLKVLSLGCGCGVDYWSLHLALRDKGEDATERVYYTGIDLIEWNYRDALKNTDVNFETLDIANLDSKHIENANVIVFPKSIGEFSERSFITLLSKLEATKIQKKRLCLLCSLMTENNSMKIDASRNIRIVDVIESKGYRTEDEKDKYWTPKEKAIRSVMYDFIYPEDIKDHIIALQTNCPTAIRNGKSCNTSCKCLKKWPILKTEYMKYQIFRFERIK